MTLTELSNQIELNPHLKDDLLKEFNSPSKVVNDFINYLKLAPVYLIPALIHTFKFRYKNDEPKTVGDLVEQHLIGTLFECEDGYYVYVGKADGEAFVRPINSEIISKMGFDVSIRWIF
jgi:hypothetical protein